MSYQTNLIIVAHHSYDGIVVEKEMEGIWAMASVIY